MMKKHLTSRLKVLLVFTLLCGLILVYQNCGKYIFSQNNPQADSTDTPQSTGVCSQTNFTEPQATITNNVDILFVVHTTGSFAAVRQTVVNGLNNFITALPANANYQIAVMPAHSPQAVKTSGYLYTPSASIPAVLSSSSLTPTQIITDLGTIMSKMPDALNAGGTELPDGSDEEGLASLYTGMNATHLAAAKALGFYRTGAALAVVFLANEADMCGETDGPIGQYSPQNTDGDYSTEVKVTMADCFSASQTAQLITAQSVYMQVQNLMQNGSGGTNPFLIGGVIFTNPAQKSGASEEEYGWGYNDLIQLDGGPAVDLNGNIAAGLTQIGQMTTTILNLVTNFTPSLNNLNPNSITVTIDGQATTNFTYQPSINQVNIPSPGHAGSVVNINYCQN